MYNLNFRKTQQENTLGEQEASSLLGLPQCSAGCRLGLCSCLWLCSTICFNDRVWDLAVLSSDQSPAGATVPACLCQQPGLGWKEHRQLQGSCPQCRKCQPGRKLVGLSSAMEQLPQSLPKARPRSCQELLLALPLCHHNHLLSAVNAGCSTPCL